MICAQDCAKDVMCNAAQAPTVMECEAQYCDYLAFYADEASSPGLLACLAADVAVSLCIVELNCEQYTQYYYDRPDTGYPCEAEAIAYNAACEGYVE